MCQIPLLGWVLVTLGRHFWRYFQEFRECQLGYRQSLASLKISASFSEDPCCYQLFLGCRVSDNISSFR